MRTLLPLLACFLLVLTAWNGSAQANGAACCNEMSSTTQMCDCCDADKSPADTDKSCPHCTAACHVHHAATPLASDLASPIATPDRAFGVRHGPALAGRDPNRMLRPPRA